MIIEYKDPSLVPELASAYKLFSRPLGMEVTLEQGDAVRLNSVEGVNGVWRLRLALIMDAPDRDLKVSVFFDFFARRISWERFEVIENWRGRESIVKIKYDDGLSYRMEKRRARPWWRKRSVKSAKEVRTRRFRPLKT